jgi:hypothetical protein
MTLLQMLYTAKRGFHLVLPAPGSKQQGKSGGGAPPAPQLPGSFILIEAGRGRGGAVSATTPALNALNARLKEAIGDCLLLTEQACAES